MFEDWYCASAEVMFKMSFSKAIFWCVAILAITLLALFANLSIHLSYQNYQPVHNMHDKSMLLQSNEISAFNETTRAASLSRNQTNHQALKNASKRDSSYLSRNLKLFMSVKDNSLYRSLNILDRGTREFVNLLVIVSTAPKRLDRRNAIRETWWPLCKNNNKVKVKCLFMTDKQNNSSKYYKDVNNEAAKFKDLEFQILGGGVEFGKRYLYHILWAVRNFEFDYILRLDDDYFVCFDKIINELPMPALPLFHWGWVHCINGLTRPEESILMFSQDVIRLFLLQDPDKMLCHPLADQMIGVWVQDLNLTPLLKFRTDRRLHHDPPVHSMPTLLREKNICQNRVGLHGSYPSTMRTLWQHRGNYKLKQETLIDNSVVCHSDLKFHWNKFSSKWRYRPKLCKSNPTWDTSILGIGPSFGGREEGFNR